MSPVENISGPKTSPVGRTSAEESQTRFHPLDGGVYSSPIFGPNLPGLEQHQRQVSGILKPPYMTLLLIILQLLLLILPLLLNVSKLGLV